MCNAGAVIFGAVNLSEREIKAKRVLEIGSRDVNGSLRRILEQWGPAEYVGIDIEQGPGVDLVCSADDVLERFGKERFDVVISTEMIEHAANWRKVISNIKNICVPGGTILLTTRSIGCGYHGYPYDFWRYEVEDMRSIFSDCLIKKLEPDSFDRGVFLKVVKPGDFRENDLSGHALYSIVERKRIKEIDESKLAGFRKRYALFQKIIKVASGIKETIFSKLLQV